MKKIVSLLCGIVVLSLSVSAQVLPKSGVQNTMWTGFGQQYPTVIQNPVDPYKSSGVRYYGLYNTLQARVDLAQFTIEGMLNWAAETNWDENNAFTWVTFSNTKKTPFWYTNNSSQRGSHTTGETESYYVNFIWNAISKDKNDLDFGMGTRLAWKIGPAPVCGGYYWEPLTHLVQGGLKEGVPGSADVVGYTHYDNQYANHALGIRYRFSDMIEAGISIPSGVTTDKPFFNAAFAIQPVDVFRASVAFENVCTSYADFYTGLTLNLQKVIIDAYLEIQNLGNADYHNKTWGTGATISFYPVKSLLIRPEAGFTFYREANYTPAFYAGGRVEWGINKSCILGGFVSLAWGSKNTDWNNDWTGGFILDARPDFTYIINNRHKISIALDFQHRVAFNNKAYQVWATGLYWTYKR
ncbi:MAG: hypothetical protein SPJ55_00845 [Treponema sp.]|nr:hypothetical protein [Treponema sp.]